MNHWFAGLDWAASIHALCVIDNTGAVREQFEIAHDAAGLRELFARLHRYAPVPIAIERPSGAQRGDESLFAEKVSCRTLPVASSSIQSRDVLSHYA